MAEFTFDIKAQVERGDFVAFDVEGDGNDNQRPVEVSFVLFSGGRPVEEAHWLLNPGRPISRFVSTIHGITDEMVADAPSFEDVRSDIEGWLGSDVLVAHNIRDDMRMLSTVSPLAPLMPRYMVDTFRLGKNLVKEIGKYNLDSLSSFLGIQQDDMRSHPVVTDYPERGRMRHSAGLDAYLVGRCLVEMVPRIGPSPKQLKHVSQACLYQISAKQRAAILETAMPEVVVGGSAPRV